MNISSNSPSPKTFTEGSASSDKNLTQGSQSSEKTVTETTNGISGDNLTSNQLGFDNPDGVAFGIGELGGIDHFKKRTPIEVTH